MLLTHKTFSIDKSLESQVVSRAYRMGASENVFVEQLVARHTIEELIVTMNKRNETNSNLYANHDKLEDMKSEYYDTTLFLDESSDNDNKPNTHAKVKFLLSNVRLIRHNETGNKLTTLKRKINSSKAIGDEKKKAKSVRFNL